MVNIVGAESNRPDNLSLSNFQFGPVNRWSFSHIREVLPTVNIEHDSESIFKLQRSKAFIKNFSIYHEDRLQEIDEIAKWDMAARGTTSCWFSLSMPSAVVQGSF